MKTTRIFFALTLAVCLTIPFILSAQYGDLTVRTGKGRLSNGISGTGFAGLSYTYHHNRIIALNIGFDYMGSGMLANFGEDPLSSNFHYETDFSNQAYIFRLGPELHIPLNNKRLSLYLRPEIGLSISSSSSDLYKVGNFKEEDLDDNDYLINDKRAHDHQATSQRHEALYFGLENGLRLKLGKIYTISLFWGISNINYTNSINEIIAQEPKWELNKIDPAGLFYMGIGLSVPIHGFIAASRAD